MLQIIRPVLANHTREAHVYILRIGLVEDSFDKRRFELQGEDEAFQILDENGILLLETLERLRHAFLEVFRFSKKVDSIFAELIQPVEQFSPCRMKFCIFKLGMCFDDAF
ncbi:hypothetical protein EV586_103425 [Tumebacillus sp. BK434]|nr:hypothetical protein EV586_103425 [Tumebacillus sp. BK434]